MLRFVWFLFFNDMSTFVPFNAKAILLKQQQWCYLTHSLENKRVHAFLKSICLKVTVIARLEFERTYYDSAVQRFYKYNTRSPTYLMGVQITYFYIAVNKLITDVNHFYLMNILASKNKHSLNKLN